MSGDDSLRHTTTLANGSESRQPRPAPPDRRANLGRYIVLDWIGRGGMGVIYAAYDPELDRKVALKILRAEALGQQEVEQAQRRLRREAQALAKLAHPNVVAVHDVGLVDGQLFVAMEFVDGRDLRDWLREEPRDWREIVELFEQAGAGLMAAHRAGLTHRDFKPANLMLGADGRIRVLDFGLAIPQDLTAAPETHPDTASDVGRSTDDARAARWTEPGRLAGTPAYMAPEQHAGSAGSALSDQFSFCVSLYEALYRQLPFDSTDREELLDNLRAGRLRPVPEDVRVPAWLRRVVERGLAVDPAKRYPSMEALLAALSREPRSRWRVAIAVTTLAIGTLAVTQYRPSMQPCQGAENHLAGIWDASRKAEIRAAFLDNPKPHANGLWQGTEALIERYTEAWTEMRTEACVATHLRGEQSEQLLDLRIDCLDRRLDDLAALTDLLSRADDETIEHSVRAAGKLGSLGSCADSRALTAIIPPPADEQARQHARALRHTLAEAKALLDLGQVEPATAAAATIDTQLSELDHSPTEAEALYLLGRIAESRDDFDLAEQQLLLAAAKADQGRHDEVRFQSAISLIWLLGHQQSDLETAHRWLELARGILERLGRPAEHEVSWQQTAAILHLRAGEYQAAVDAASLGVELSRRHLGATHRQTARSLSTLGNARYRQGRYDAALATFSEVSAIRRQTLGPTHPEVAYSQQAEGEMLKNLGRYDEARDLLTEALVTLETVLGANHSKVAIAVDSLGNTYSRLGQPELALTALRRGLGIWRDLLGEDSSKVAASLNNIALVLKTQQRYEEAVEHLQQALTIHQRVDGAEHPATLIARVNLGRLLLEGDRPRQAQQLLEPAHEAALRTLGTENTTSLHASLTLGETLVRLGQTESGARWIADAAALIERDGAADWLLGTTRFAQAQASWAIGHRQDAQRLSDEARTIFTRMGAAGRYRRQQVERWERANAIAE